MDNDLVPDDAYRSTYLTSKLCQKLDDTRTPKVHVVSQHIITQAHACSLRTNGYCANHRNATMRITNLVYRCASARCKGAPYRWGHHESGFIDKNEVSVPLLRLPFYPRKLFRFPAANLCIVTFCCLLRWPYSRPTQIIGQDVPYMAAAKLDCKVPPVCAFRIHRSNEFARTPKIRETTVFGSPCSIKSTARRRRNSAALSTERMIAPFLWR